jgi:TPR repeat protein
MSVAEWNALLAKAKEGNPEAEWGVAGRFEDGCKDKKGNILVRRSARKFAEWIRRAAEHGCAPAQNTLGVLLGDTAYTGRNPREALLWLEKAFRAGESLAASNIAITHR